MLAKRRIVPGDVLENYRSSSSGRLRMFVFVFFRRFRQIKHWWRSHYSQIFLVKKHNWLKLQQILLVLKIETRL